MLSEGRRQELETIDLAREIVDLLVDKKAEDIVLIDLQGLTVMTDYFIICSGNSERQLRGLMSGVRSEIKQKHEQMMAPRVEGEASSGWVLIDYGSIVVHVFTPELRAFYDLESLWREGRIVVRVK